MNLTRANETDVREDVAMPFLAALGYARGTPNNIAREVPLRYERQYLGRKKQTDPPLRGRADYILSVTGAGKWVLELKAPSEAIDQDAVEQAISYGRHPEVAATYAVVLNGLRLTVHHITKTSADPPLLDLAVADPLSLAEDLRALLSPAAMRRDCRPPIVDLGKPLAEGLRSRADLLRGEIHHDDYTWSSNFPLPLEGRSALDEMARRLTGYRVPVTGGTVYRDETSRIRARLKWSLPHDELLKFAIDKKLMDADYLALGDHISADVEHPSVFDVVGTVQVKKGEALFNQLNWVTKVAGVSLTMGYTGQATGFIADYAFQGTFTSRNYCNFPAAPGEYIEGLTNGTFCIEVDRR